MTSAAWCGAQLENPATLTGSAKGNLAGSDATQGQPPPNRRRRLRPAGDGDAAGVHPATAEVRAAAVAESCRRKSVRRVAADDRPTSKRRR